MCVEVPLQGIQESHGNGCSSTFTATDSAPSYCVMKKRDLFPMNEMDLKLSKIIIFSNQYTKF